MMAESGSDVLRIAGEGISSVTNHFPILVSVTYYSLFLITGHILRDIVRQHIGLSYRPFVLDAVTTFQVLGCSLENGQVRLHYGYLAYIFTIFLLMSWYSLTLGTTSANPCSRVVAYVCRTSTFRHSVLSILMQVVGAMLAYHTAKVFWSLGLTEGHRNRLAVRCQSDLTVSLPTGTTMESLGSAFEFLLWSVTLSSTKISHSLEIYGKCLIMSLLTAAGVAYTGMYLNPLNASNQTFGCDGTSAISHLIVYWVGPLLATSATAIFLSGLNRNSTDAKIRKIA